MWKLLDFDSACLGVKVASVEDDQDAANLSRILKDCYQNEVNLAVLKTPRNLPRDRLNSFYTVGLYARAASFAKTISCQPRTDGATCSTNPRRLSRFEATEIRSKLIKLAFISGKYSRFNTDPALTRSQFRRLYISWTDNIIANADHDYIVAAFDSENSQEVVGFISFSIQKSYAKIGLFAVAPSMQRKGTGTVLMRYLESVAACHNCASVHVATQSENFPAVSFYKKSGYRLENEMNVYHFWLLTKHKILQNVPYFTNLEILGVSDMLKRNSIESGGRATKSCQEWLENLMNCPSVLLTGSATAALEQAAILCDLGPGDEVIMPSYTFVSTANAICLRGAVPVFVDIDINCQIDVFEVEKAICKKTKAVIAVHYAGQCCRLDVLVDLCNRHGIFLIEDAAQAFLSRYNGRFLGTFGHFGCFSFHYTKNTICGEGGALLVNEKAFVNRAHIVWEKGTNRFDFINGNVNKYEWVDIGSSYVPNELSASFLEAQLQDSWYCSHRRRCIVSLYRLFLQPLLKDGSIIRMMSCIQDVSCNGHLFWLLLKEKDVSAFKTYMERCGIVCYSHYQPLHNSPGGMKYSVTASKSMENTILVGNTLMRLPLWVNMTHIDIYRVVSSILTYFSHPGVHLNDVYDEFHRMVVSNDLDIARTG